MIEEPQRMPMVRKGRWIGQGEEIGQDGVITGERIKRDIAGFWITGFMSPFLITGIGGIAQEKEAAERTLQSSGEDKDIRTVMAKHFGIPYSPKRKAGSLNANDIADRAEQPLTLGVVPEGVRFLTCAADVQKGYFEYLVRGWGANGESWVVDRGKILAEPSTSLDDWDKLLSEVFQKRYPLSTDPLKFMQLRACGFDSAGEPGVTQQAYAAWLRWVRVGAVRSYGQSSGREAWSIIPTKGASTKDAPKLSVTYPDSGRLASKVASGSVPVAVFNPNSFKDDLAGHLAKMEKGPWFIHFPYALRSSEQPHIFFEQLVSEIQTKNGSWIKTTPNARNEALDLMVMNHVIAHLHGLARIDWNSPPLWAAAWDVNTAITGSQTEMQKEEIKAKAVQSLVSQLA